MGPCCPGFPPHPPLPRTSLSLKMTSLPALKAGQAEVQPPGPLTCSLHACLPPAPRTTCNGTAPSEVSPGSPGTQP